MTTLNLLAGRAGFSEAQRMRTGKMFATEPGCNDTSHFGRPVTFWASTHSRVNQAFVHAQPPLQGAGRDGGGYRLAVRTSSVGMVSGLI